MDMIEKNLLRYDVDVFSRMVRAFAQKGFSDDFVFWDKFVFRYVYYDGKLRKDRTFTNKEAKKLWDTFVFLKLKCPSIDISDVLFQLERFMDRDDDPA